MENQNAENNAKETTRLEIFSDGVFAIAITLLVLELNGMLQADSNGKLLNILLHHWRSFVAFIIGFITILVCWINHHVALEYIKKVDTVFMWINGFLLFVVTLTPFSTAILAGYLENEGRTAVAIFGFNYVLISLAADGICTYAYRKHLVHVEHREFYHLYKKIYRFAVFYNMVALILCCFSVIAPIIMYTVLFVFFAFPKEFALRIFRLRKSD